MTRWARGPRRSVGTLRNLRIRQPVLGEIRFNESCLSASEEGRRTCPQGCERHKRRSLSFLLISALWPVSLAAGMRVTNQPAWEREWRQGSHLWARRRRQDPLSVSGRSPQRMSGKPRTLSIRGTENPLGAGTLMFLPPLLRGTCTGTGCQFHLHKATSTSFNPPYRPENKPENNQIGPDRPSGTARTDRVGPTCHDS